MNIRAYSDISDEQIFKWEGGFGANHYGRVNLAIRGARGVWLYDARGNKYFDCLAAYSAANQGHLHPAIKSAVIRALTDGHASVISNVVYTDSSAIFLKKVSRVVPRLAPRFKSKGNKVLLKNGGVESVETAIKIMSDYGHRAKKIPDGKQRIIVFKNNFHGRTGRVVGFSSTPKYKKGFRVGQKKGAFLQADFGDASSVEKLLKRFTYTCGILVEPMQGEGGMNIPPRGFLQRLRELADEHDCLLAFDEIQVGLGRTGKMFCFQHERVTPDILILGKAISGGVVPVSACVTCDNLMDQTFYPGRDGSTYGGYPLACVAGIAALDVIKNEKLAQNAAKMGKILKKRLREAVGSNEQVKEIRGRGLFIGIEVNNGDAMKYCRELLKLGLLANDSHGHTIRISPPLIIGESHIDYIVERIEKVFDTVI